MKLILAPMAGITTGPYREIVRRKSEGKADIIFTEMISARGVLEFNRVSLDMLPRRDEECHVQLFGNSPDDFVKATQFILEHFPNITGIDINAACPVKKVVRNGAGASLVSDLPKLREILSGMAGPLHEKDKWLSLKIRKGWEGAENYLRVFNICEEYGADFLSIHGRTVEQGYSGRADRRLLEQFPEIRKTAVYWTGDVNTFEDIDELSSYEDYLDGILFARGTYGNPWFIADAYHYINGLEIESRGLTQQVETIHEHIDLMLGKYHKSKVLGQFKRFVAGYTWGIKNAREKRNIIYRSRELETLIDRLIATISAEYEDQEKINAE